jgi:iron complex outermembrane receptor protein
MRKRQVLIVLGLVFGDVDVGFIFTPAAFSAERKGAISEELRLLKEETVSIAARHEQPISEAPSNVYVITDEDIRQSGATDLPTVLRRVPGIEVMQVTGADINVSARGDNQLFANKMLVMVDGRSIYVDTQALVYWKSIPITLPEIKRIEVIIGPASALYGFNAFDGVVNIVTKPPEEMKGTTLQFGGGEFGTLTASAIQAGTHEKFGYRLSVGRDQNNQWRDRGALAFRAHKFNVQTEYSLSQESKIQLSGGLVDGNRFDGPGSVGGVSASAPSFGYANILYERPNFFIRSWWTKYQDTTTPLTHPLLANLLRFGDRDLNFNDLNTSADTYDFEIQHAIQSGATNRLTYGVNYRRNTISSQFLSGSTHEDRLGFYLQDEWRISRTVNIVGGLRYDLHTEINGTLSPRLAFIYKPVPDHTLRLAVGVAYRPPTLAETHVDVRNVATIPTGLPPPFPSVITAISPVKGSSNLHPEEIVSYEIGYHGWFLKHRLLARANLFFNHVSDLIEITSPNPFNGREADIYGGETGIEFLATSWLTGFANYAYEEIGQTFVGETIRRAAPRHKVNLGLRGEFENGLSGEIALYHYGSTTYPISADFAALAPFGAMPPNPRVGSYNLLNLRAGYRFWKEKAELAVSVFNALNDRHKEHPLGDTIGSRVMGWLTIRF